jgi:2-polyprenyl-3-methyl-5-hydroxy-6-metoxy-1,4-benzoquinol methylase
MKINKCRICGNSESSEEYVLREMMFGTREEFEYFKCEKCGCLQIISFPENIQSYYPNNYLSFPQPDSTALKKYFMKKREHYLIRRRGLLGKFLARTFGIPAQYLWITRVDLKPNDSILEVGCGNGEFLLKMKEAGFNNLLGIDPFIEKDKVYDQNFKVLKKTIKEIYDLQFDWIMFHHSFEHLDNPHEIFEVVNKLLKYDGKIIIRIPVVDSYAWEHYKTDWVQLDPPRHYFLYTVKSLEHLTEKYGFVIDDIIYDSTAFQFIGSEQYRRNIPFISPNSYFQSSKYHIFRKEEIKSFQRKAVELNKIKKGDSAGFLLKRKI